MRFSPNQDQAAFLDMVEKMAASAEAGWRAAAPDWKRFDPAPAFDRLIEESGFLDCALEPTLGLEAAAALTIRLARLPVLVECAASAMTRPRLAPDLPRPVAVIEGDAGAPIRNLPAAKSAIWLGPEGVKAARLEPGAVETVDSLFAYPMGRLARGRVEWKRLDTDPAAARDLWRVAVAAELTGVLWGGLDVVVAHVRDRHQFGRPLGSFQAIQHRLAGAVTRIEAARWLTLKAAKSLDPVDVAIALGWAQDISTRIVNDLHQFMGAMGLTLEHPLHRFTYRARLLRSTFGGAAAAFQAVAARRWRAA